MNTDLLIEILEASVVRNGEIPLTNKHLCNILKMGKRVQEKREEEELLFKGLTDEWS
jgi:hypothetical protein